MDLRHSKLWLVPSDAESQGSLQSYENCAFTPALVDSGAGRENDRLGVVKTVESAPTVLPPQVGTHVVQGVNSPSCLSQYVKNHGAGRRVLGRRERGKLPKYYKDCVNHPPTSPHCAVTNSTRDYTLKSDALKPVYGSKSNPSIIMTVPTDPEGVSKGLLVNGTTPASPELPKGTPERETWGKKLDFLLSVVGFAVDLGNVWRFPYICYKNGGGAFLIPYLVMLVFAGIPLFYMELALGQYQRCGMLSVWRNICPIFGGLGYGMCLIAVFVAMYYNTVIAWAVFYTVSCFRSEVPWARCDNDWNTPDCFSVLNFNLSGVNKSSSTSSAEEFFNRRVLEMQYSSGIDNVGGLKWDLTLCLLAVFVIIYFSLWKGIKSSGKAVWITATLPYIVLLILLVRGCTLPGAADGILYYVRPQWDKLLVVEVWIDAAAQIFFSLGPGFGTLLALSSYNKFNNNCYMDALITASINCATSFLAGFVVFSVLGYMAYIQKETVENVAIHGPGLVFVVYPEALATLDGSVFWSILFFLMLITLGLDSAFGGLEAVITGICDEFPRIGKHREILVGVLLSVCFLGGLSSATYGGQYVISLMDCHAAPISILLICFFEAVAVSWFYGVKRFSQDLKKMLGFEPGIFWKICWAGICPVFLLVLFVLSCYIYSGIELGDYVFPPWSLGLGWVITSSSIICVPAFAIYKLLSTHGTLSQRLQKAITPTGTTFRTRPELNETELPIKYSICEKPQSSSV